MMIPLYRFSLTLGILLLTACSSLNPKYPPSVVIPLNWHSKDPLTRTATTNTDLSAWWKQFNDPELDRLINDAFINNNDLGVARGNLLQAEADLQKVQMSWLPSLSLGGTAFAGELADVSIHSSQLADTPLNPLLSHSSRFDGIIGGFIPSYTLNIMKQISEGRAARLNIAMQNAMLQAVRLGIISQVAGGYFSLQGLKQQLHLQEQLISDAKTLRRVTFAEYQNGLTSEEQVAALDQFIAILNQKLPTIHHNITTVENALLVLCNKNPSTIQTLKSFTTLGTDHIIPVNLPSEILKTRPDIAIAEYQLKMSHAMFHVAVSSLFPSISLTGLLGGVSLELTKLVNMGNALNIGQVIAGVPIVNLSIYAEIKKAKGKEYSAYYQYLSVIRKAFAEVDNGLSLHSTLNQTYHQQQIALNQAKKQYAIFKKQYELGAISYLKTMMAKLNVDYMEANLNLAKMELMRSIVNLYQVLGGGIVDTP